MNIKIIKTDDGSNSLYHSEIEESYHSSYGAVTESKHVFLQNGLARLDKDPVVIFEAGFGTGLNAYLAAIYAWEKQINISYYSLDKFPLDNKLINNLNYKEILEFPEFFDQICDLEWESFAPIHPYFRLKKLKADLLSFDFSSIPPTDLIFFDAFSPSKQPRLWQTEVFSALYKILNINGILVTYAASGLVKTSLRQAGFVIKRLAGPPGKHHMLLAHKSRQQDE